MDETAQADARPARLNPFVFPSATDVRFVLLIVSLIGSSLFIYNVLSLNIQKKAIIAAEACTLQHMGSLSALQQCLAPFTRVQTLWEISGVVLVLGVATVIYWLFPAYLLRSRRLVPLSNEDASEVVAYLSNLCSETGLTSAPRFVWNPLNLSCSPLAFGRPGQYYIAFPGGLITMFYTDRAAFRAIVLHELAHLRNADLNKAYFTIAVWWAFVAVVLVPFVIYLVVSQLNRWDDAFTILSLGLVLALVVLVYLSRNAVLRVREFYADVRASEWDGSSGALNRVLSVLPHIKGGWWRIMRVHPAPAKRYQVLHKPQELFSLSRWEAFGAGFAIGIALPSVQSILSYLSTEQAQVLHKFKITLPNVQRILASLSKFELPGVRANIQITFPTDIWYNANDAEIALVFAPLIIGIIGLSIWRATFATLVKGQELRGVGRVAFCLGLGLAVGSFLYFYASSFTYSFVTGLTNTMSFSSSNLSLSILLLIGSFFFLKWIGATGSPWLEVAATSRSPQRIFLIWLTIAGAIGVAGLVILLSLNDVIGLGISAIPDLFIGVLELPVLLLLLMGMWAFPLAAWFWHRRGREVPETSWMFLDASPQRVPLPLQAPFRPRFALRVGLVGGLVFCGLLFVIRIGAHLSVPESIRSTDQFIWAFYLSNLALAALLQAGIAGIVTGRVRRLGSLHGLFAAFVGGCVMTAGMLGLNLLFGGTATADFIWQTFSLVVNGGALLALPIAFGVSATAGWIRKTKDDEVKVYAK